MSADKRDSRRRSIMAPGVVTGGAKKPLQICFVENLSASGAKLRLNIPDDVPDQFTLLLSRDGKISRNCRIVWRSDREIGVQFLPPENATKKRAVEARFKFPKA
jgi:hypothetical protein